MRWKSSGDRYGAVAMMIHWLTAFAVAGLLVSGLVAAGETDDVVKATILRVHVPFGVLVLVLTLVRIAWWVAFDRRPAAAQSESRTQMALARIVHLAFYAVLIALGASGIAMLALSGAATTLFFGREGPLPDFTIYAPRTAHGIFAWVLIGMITAHVGAALFHQFIKRDGLLQRMGLFAWPARDASAARTSRAFSANS